MENGLTTRAISIDGVTECSPRTNTPTSDLLSYYSILLVGNNLFLFGGKLAKDGGNFGTDAAYKYDLTTDTWTQIASLAHKRYLSGVVLLEENEIIITGKVINISECADVSTTVSFLLQEAKTMEKF